MVVSDLAFLLHDPVVAFEAQCDREEISLGELLVTYRYLSIQESKRQ